MKHRLAIGLEYAGTNYSGWQKQVQNPEIPSIQAQLELALAKVAAHPVEVFCAGRTDAGVHASSQVVHCDVMVQRPNHAWVAGSNVHLPPDIRVLWAKPVSAEFDARRSAIKRHYQYVLYNNRIRPSLLRDLVSWHYNHLEIEPMQLAAQMWLGEHDFSSFRGAGCQSKSPIRELYSLDISRRDELIFFDIMANAFLYHMVRNMVGALLEIGMGRKPVAWAQEVLEARDRTKASITAPPQGLYLAGVYYPPMMEIPEDKVKIL